MDTTKARIFVSYSHRGNGPEWKARLLRHLAVFEQQHLLDIWQDGKIRVSSYWDDDIQQAMNDARLAVVLLTPEALESEYILNKEFPTLQERQRQDKLSVFPVICEECDWGAFDWLSATQAPNASKPLSQLSEAARERVFRGLATAIAEELSRVALAELPRADGTQPPVRAYLDRFPLPASGLREEKLIGREQEIALLDLAFTQRHTAIVSLVAWGGVGKTMLVQHWLMKLQREDWLGAQRVYAWSFYSQGIREDRQASEDSFLADALDWFGVQCEPTLSPWDKGRLLADAVARERTLLILDGIEPLQYPPGPMGGQLRAFGVQSLLKQLARKANLAKSEIQNSKSETNCLCLVTTREPLTDLANFQRREGSAWGSVLRVDLGNLTDEAGAALLHHAGANKAGAAEIKSDDKELLAASCEVDGHALTMNLLGRFLARAHGGDIRRRDLVNFQEADREEQGGTTFKTLAAFENWFSRGSQIELCSLAILRLLGLFAEPSEFGWLNVLRKRPPIRGLTDELFDSKIKLFGLRLFSAVSSDESFLNCLSFLSDLNLISSDRAYGGLGDDTITIDSHPLIREYFSKALFQTNGRGYRVLHRRMFQFFFDRRHHTSPHPSFEELRPLFMAIYHGCKAEMFVRAAALFMFEVLGKPRAEGGWAPNQARLNIFSSELNVLACFFNKPWTQLADGTWKLFAYRASILAQVSYSLRALGRTSEAVDPLKQALILIAQTKTWHQECGACANISELQLTLGDIANAIKSAERAVEIADQHKELLAFEREGFRGRLADAYFQKRDIDRAKTLLHEAEVLLRIRQPSHQFLYSLQGFFYSQVLMHDAEVQSWRMWLCRQTLPASFGLLDAVEDRTVRVLFGTVFESGAGQRDLGLHHLILCRCALFRSIFKERRDKLVNALDPKYPESDQLLDMMGKAKSYLGALPKCRTRALDIALGKADYAIEEALEDLRAAGDLEEVVRGLLTRAWIFATKYHMERARNDLDDAWDIAERGPMRLHMTDIHLYRARLFFREKSYPWKSPQLDLAAAEKLISECGYHRRDEELADAKRAIPGGAA